MKNPFRVFLAFLKTSWEHALSELAKTRFAKLCAKRVKHAEDEARSISHEGMRIYIEHIATIKQLQQRLANQDAIEHELRRDLAGTQTAYEGATARFDVLQTEMDALRESTRLGELGKLTNAINTHKATNVELLNKLRQTEHEVTVLQEQLNTSHSIRYIVQHAAEHDGDEGTLCYTEFRSQAVAITDAMRVHIGEDFTIIELKR